MKYQLAMWDCLLRRMAAPGASRGACPRASGDGPREARRVVVAERYYTRRAIPHTGASLAFAIVAALLGVGPDPGSGWQGRPVAVGFE